MSLASSPGAASGGAALGPTAPRHTHEPTSIGDSNDKDDRGDDEDETLGESVAMAHVCERASPLLQGYSVDGHIRCMEAATARCASGARARTMKLDEVQ